MLPTDCLEDDDEKVVIETGIPLLQGKDFNSEVGNRENRNDSQALASTGQKMGRMGSSP
jgi:hypothetical protein